MSTVLVVAHAAGSGMPRLAASHRLDRKDRAAESRGRRRAEELRDHVRGRERRRDASGDEESCGDRRIEVRAGFPAEDVHRDRQREAVRQRDADQPGFPPTAGVLHRIAPMPAKHR